MLRYFGDLGGFQSISGGVGSLVPSKASSQGISGIRVVFFYLVCPVLCFLGLSFITLLCYLPLNSSSSDATLSVAEMNRGGRRTCKCFIFRFDLVFDRLLSHVIYSMWPVSRLQSLGSSLLRINSQLTVWLVASPTCRALDQRKWTLIISIGSVTFAIQC